MVSAWGQDPRRRPKHLRSQYLQVTNQTNKLLNRFYSLTLTKHFPKDNYPWKAGFVFRSLGSKQEVAAWER